jgi:hypothetical protein
MPTKPWIEGPLELLKHGIEHLELGSGFDTRIAMISIDNAVELMIKTYLGLPSRVTNITGLSRRRYEEISQNFSSLLDAFEEFAPDKIVGIELGDIEWFHRLRNQLYHEGNGITAERGKVEGYAEIAKILLANLFGVVVEELIKEKPLRENLEQKLFRLRDKYMVVKKDRYTPLPTLVRQLEVAGNLPESYTQKLNLERQFRNELVHGVVTPSADDLEGHTTAVKNLLKTVSDL